MPDLFYLRVCRRKERTFLELKIYMETEFLLETSPGGSCSSGGHVPGRLSNLLLSEKARVILARSFSPDKLDDCLAALKGSIWIICFPGNLLLAFFLRFWSA
ncbi:hypothetical protein RUM43_002474 [Polyplax serrata]|uniref:Uncharacterized protein n=1 Tax=Polyplax serrata TaxID=468196 RepID=A0AAN8S610_POLSC